MILHAGHFRTASAAMVVLHCTYVRDGSVCAYMCVRMSQSESDALSYRLVMAIFLWRAAHLTAKAELLVVHSELVILRV